MKNIFRYLVVCLVLLLALPSPTLIQAQSSTFTSRELKMADANASTYSKELFAFLQNSSGEQILFGQQHATDEGLTLKESGTRVGSKESEVKNAVGDYPAIFGWDTGSIDGNEKPGIPGNIQQSIKNTATSMKTAHKLGGIITLSMHPRNFVTGGNYNDTTGNVVKEILPGGSKHEEFNAWLDNIASLAHQLKDDNGEPIPLIFRPFHEQTGSWFWWGASTTSPSQYKAIYRYTVEYLRDVKDVHNILYGFSPGSGYSGDTERYLETYPGDEYVDIFGIDSYDNKSNAGSASWLNGLIDDLKMIVQLAEEKDKIAGLTEFGYSASGMNQTGNTLDWYTRVFNAIKGDTTASKIAYMLTWANFGWPNNMYVPYKDIDSELGGDHELLPNFQKFYEDDYSSFRNEVTGKVYGQGINYTTAPHGSLLYVLSPTNGTTITEQTTTLRVKVTNDPNAMVTYKELATETEHRMELDSSGNFTADYSPSAHLNGGVTDIVFTYYSNGQKIQEETVRLYIKVQEITIKKLTFDTDINDIKSNGTWPSEGVTYELSHETLNGDGKAKFSVQGMSPSEAWQELKLELTNLDSINLADVKQIRFDVYIPVTAGNGSIQGIVQLPPDWTTKYGMNESKEPLTELETITIDGKDYMKYETTISVPSASEATGIALSLVGDQLQLTEIYIDNIELLNTYKEAAADPYLVDNFEYYLGDNDLLNRNYSSNGDPIQISLSSDAKQGGTYGLKYDYIIGNAGYAGKQTSLPTVDWTGTNAIQFWMKHQSQSHHLTVQIQMGGVSFEKNISLEQEFEGVVTIPFSEFAPAEWESNQTAVIDQARIQKVTQFALYTGGEKGSGTLYFDDIRAIEDKDSPTLPEEVGDNEEKNPSPIFYHFNKDLEGWEGGNAIIEQGQLKASIKLGEGEKTEIKKTASYDLTGYNYIVVQLKHDDTGTLADHPLEVKFFTKSGSWNWSDSGSTTINKEEYTKLIYDISNLENKNAVQELGMEFNGPVGSADSTNALIDYVAIVTSLDQLPSEEEANTEEENEEEPSISTPDNPDIDDDHSLNEQPNSENPPVVNPDKGNQTSDIPRAGDNDTNIDSKGENSLPNTANNLYNFLLFGILLLLGGAIALYFSYRKKWIKSS